MQEYVENLYFYIHLNVFSWGRLSGSRYNLTTLGLSEKTAIDILKSERFAECVLITKFNKPVTSYALQRSRLFAQIKKQQLLWIEAEDSLPRAHFSEHGNAELRAMKRQWMHYHARRSEGILSLMPCTYDLAMRVANVGNRAKFKKHGIHKGSLCRIRAWTLHEEDEALLETSKESEICLKHLPLCLFVEVIGGLKEQVDGLPKDWFPLVPSTSVWSLDKDENIEIERKGFPLVPDFSSTIHVATGRTLESEISDLGGFEDRPSHRSAMEAYIALSRATDAEGVLITRPFSPTLFRQKAQPFPTYLLELLTSGKDLDLSKCERIQKEMDAGKKKTRPCYS